MMFFGDILEDINLLMKSIVDVESCCRMWCYLWEGGGINVC